MAEENRYAVATGNWTDTATWSTSSGGSGGASVPDTDQHAIIESGVNVTINANDEIKSLTVNSSTFLFKPTIKTIAELSYKNRNLIEEKDFGYEKKGLFAAIVSPKKSLVFNKTIYRNFIDSSYSTIK